MEPKPSDAEVGHLFQLLGAFSVGALIGAVIAAGRGLDVSWSMDAADAIGVATNIAVVVFIPFYFDRVTRRRAAWQPAASNELELIVKLAGTVASAFAASATAVVNKASAYRILQSIDDAQAQLERVELRVTLAHDKAFAQEAVKPIDAALVALRSAVSVRHFAGKDFQADRSEVAAVKICVANVQSAVFTLQHRLSTEI